MTFLKANMATITGVVLGAIAGYFYYQFAGCYGCMITSSPFRSTGYGALLGGLAVNAFQRKKGEEDNH